MNFEEGKIVEEFDGKKVIFRYPKMEDAEDCMELINSIVGEDHYIMKVSKVDLEEEKEWLKGEIEGMENDDKIRLHVEVDGKVMGGVDMNREEREAQQHVGEIGIILSKKIRDMGIGTKLINKICEISKEELDIEIIKISYIKGNERAKHVYEKLGFEEVGVFPKSRKINNSYDDEVLMYKEI